MTHLTFGTDEKVEIEKGGLIKIKRKRKSKNEMKVVRVRGTARIWLPNGIWIQGLTLLERK